MSEQISPGGVVRTAAREAAVLAGSAAFSALLVAPHAYNHAVETTEIHTQVAEFPADLSYYPRTSRLDFLNQATMYADKTQHDIGINVEATGLPRFTSFNDVSRYFSPKQLDIYLSMADSPGKVIDGYKADLVQATLDNGRSFEAQWGGVGTAALYGGTVMLRLNRRRREEKAKNGRLNNLLNDVEQAAVKDAQDQSAQMRSLSEKLAAVRGAEFEADTPTKPERRERRFSSLRMLGGLGALALAATMTIAGAQHAQWLDSAPKPDTLTTISALNGTQLEGAQTDNPVFIQSIETGIRYGLRLKERRTDKRDDYLEKVEPQIAEGIADLPDLRDNEVLITTITDNHASVAGLKINRLINSSLQERFGADKLAGQVNIGDISQAGDFQEQAVEDQADVGNGIEQVLTLGNHDTSRVKKWIKDTAFKVVDGYTKLKDILIYGRADPQQTPFLESSSFPGEIKSETELGELVAKDLAEQPTDILALHQPTALGAALGIDNITEELNSPEHTDLTSCDFQGMGAGNDEAPVTKLAEAGHWHDQYPLKMYCFQNGEWTVLNVQGSSGGANETPTPNDWSDPDGVPIKDIDDRVFVYNAKYDSITGVYDIVVTPLAVVQPIERTDIGTYDGSPFTVEYTAGDKKARAAMRQERTTNEASVTQ